MTAFGEYCPYAKAAEHLGDRWSLMIIKELAMYGSRGFNALAGGLPGVARSVLVRRLRMLEELGVIMRDPMVHSRRAPYRLAPAGEQLVPTLLSLDTWAKRWVPEDPALALRDPDVITFWLTNRIEPRALPDRQVVVAFDIGGPRATHRSAMRTRALRPSDTCTWRPTRQTSIRSRKASPTGAARSPMGRCGCTASRRSSRPCLDGFGPARESDPSSSRARPLQSRQASREGPG